jgi:hypothetical protein
MNFTKSMFAVAIGSVGIASAMSAQAANTFSFEGGGTSVNSGLSAPAGSWFSMLALDTDSDYVPDTNTFTAVRAVGSTTVPGPNGLLDFDITNTITTSLGGTNHNSGNMIDKDWNFFGAFGAHFTTGALEVTWDGISTTASVNMSDWRVTWNGIPSINMGSGAPGTLSAGGDALWGTGDDTFDYSAIVPVGDPSGFGGVAYALHMEGSAALTAPIPEASTYGMMLAGLGLVGFAVRRRKQSI